jgi:hypothetical protein
MNDWNGMETVRVELKKPSGESVAELNTPEHGAYAESRALEEGMSKKRSWYPNGCPECGGKIHTGLCPGGRYFECDDCDYREVYDTQGDIPVALPEKSKEFLDIKPEEGEQ